MSSATTTITVASPQSTAMAPASQNPQNSSHSTHPPAPPPLPQKLKKLITKHASSRTKRRKLKKLLKSGLKREDQFSVWCHLTGASKIRHKMLPYEHYVKQESSFDSQIEKDVPRTFPDQASFLHRHEELFRCLHALSVYVNDYVQGLSYVCGFVLLSVPHEEECFFIMVQLFNTYGMRELYANGFPHLHRLVGAFNILLESQIPQLHRHFEKLGVPSSLFMHRVLLTMFAMQFPFELVSRIMDVFVLQKWRVVMKVALQMLYEHQERMLAMDYEHLLFFLQRMDKVFDAKQEDGTPGVNIDEFFNRAMKRDIKRSFNKALRRYDKQQRKEQMKERNAKQRIGSA